MTNVSYNTFLYIDFLIIYNPFFDISNNLLSLWQERHEMESDFIIINGDDIMSTLIALTDEANAILGDVIAK